MEKAIRAIWLPFGFLEKLVAQPIFFAPFQWVNLITYMIKLCASRQAVCAILAVYAHLGVTISSLVIARISLSIKISALY